MSIIRNEKDVRQWLARIGRGKVFWVEPRSGGTIGMPDTLVVVDGRFVPVELKAGKVEEGAWCVDLRPSQMMVLRRMCVAGGEPMILVGRVGTQEFYLVAARAALAAGRKVPISVARVEGWKECETAIKDNSR